MKKVLRLLGVFLSFITMQSAADIVTCGDTAAGTTTVCRKLYQKARSDADLLAKKYSGKVKRTIEPNSDIMVKSTSEISAIYSRADQECQKMVDKCLQACTGDGALFASACGTEMGKYKGVLNWGKDQNDNGTAKGNVSKARSISSD